MKEIFRKYIKLLDKGDASSEFISLLDEMKVTMHRLECCNIKTFLTVYELHAFEPKCVSFYMKTISPASSGYGRFSSRLDLRLVIL